MFVEIQRAVHRGESKMTEKFKDPLFVTKAVLPEFDNYVEKIKPIWENNWLTNNGPIHDRLELRLKQYLKAENLTLFTNGHLALDSAVKALNLSGEVITTPFTFVSTAHAVRMNNLQPVFCDIKLSDYTIDEDKIEQLITEKTSAIIPVHVYGHPCNVEKIQQIADRYGLKVIYDAAHAFGVEYDQKPISRFGDISMFSFHATKVFNTIEGGALTFRNAEYKHKLDLLKNFGIEGPESVSMVALNAKMNEFQAAMGLANLEHIEQNFANRKCVYNTYKTRLSNVPGLKFPDISGNVLYNYSYVPILVDERLFGKTRDGLFDRLGDYNIFPRKYFYPLITHIQAYSDCVSRLDNAEYVSERILCLPIYADMEVWVAQKVCEIIIEIYNS